MNIISNYILKLKLYTEIYQQDILGKRLGISRNIFNSCLGELYKRYKRYNHMKSYNFFR